MGVFEYVGLRSVSHDEELACTEVQNTKESRRTGPLTRPFAHSLKLLTHLLTLHCLLRLRAPLCSFVKKLMAKRFFYEMNASISCTFHPV